MDYLGGKKTIPQITDPAHCLDLITPYALGDVTPQRASEVLSKALISAYEEQTASNMFQEGQEGWLLVFGLKKVLPRPKPCPALKGIQYLLKRPDIPVHPFQLPAGDVQTLIATNAQIRELLLEGGTSVSDLRDKDRYSQVTKIGGVQIDNTENIYKAFQGLEDNLKEELTAAEDQDRRDKIESRLKEIKELENKLESEQSQKAKAAKSAKKRFSYLIDHKIEPHHEELARYLRKTIRREKNCLIDRPDQDHPIVWEF